MKNIVKYNFINNDSILIRSFYGEIDNSFLIKTWDDVIKYVETHNIKSLITDFRESNIDELDIETKDIIISIIRKYKNFFNNIKIATVIDSPKIYIPTIATYDLKPDDIMLKCFSTIESAIKWAKE